MGRKKYSVDFKRQVVLHYLNGNDGLRVTAHTFGIDTGAVRRWAEHWQTNGDAGFTLSTRTYSADFKVSVIQDMWENGLSSRKAAAKYQIAMACTVSRWERIYREKGIIALHNKPKGRKTMTGMKDSKITSLTAPPPVFKSVEEELEYLRAENAYLKKLKALPPQGCIASRQKQNNQ